MEVYTVYTSIKATFTFAIMKKGRNFFVSFVLYLNVFCKF